MGYKVIVETSARHIHLTQEDVELLFGKGSKLTFKRDLSQPGQFVTNEKLDVIGPKNQIKGVTILGPERSATQVEISATDARTIGLKAPIRDSGDVNGSAPCKLVGPCGEIEISQGVIIAKRHIHMTTKTASEAGVKDKQSVCVKINTDERGLIFDDVIIRISDEFGTSMHIDTDEANAANAIGNVEGEILI